jgi:hypothetical protein
MKLLPLSMTSRTFGGQTLHSTLAKLLLCIVLAMALAASCQLDNTWCQCYFVLHGEIHFVEAVVGDIAAVEALALRAHVLDDEGTLLLIAALPKSLFLV